MNVCVCVLCAVRCSVCNCLWLNYRALCEGLGLGLEVQGLGLSLRLDQKHFGFGLGLGNF